VVPWPTRRSSDLARDGKGCASSLLPRQSTTPRWPHASLPRELARRSAHPQSETAAAGCLAKPRKWCRERLYGPLEERLLSAAGARAGRRRHKVQYIITAARPRPPTRPPVVGFLTTLPGARPAPTHRR